MEADSAMKILQSANQVGDEGKLGTGVIGNVMWMEFSKCLMDKKKPRDFDFGEYDNQKSIM